MTNLLADLEAAGFAVVDGKVMIGDLEGEIVDVRGAAMAAPEPEGDALPEGPRALVCGGRDYNDRERVARILDAAVERLGVKAIIHGCARGADFEAKRWAMLREFPAVEFRADWTRHRKAAGIIRNQQMLDEGKPDLVIAFPGGAGTADMVQRA